VQAFRVARTQLFNEARPNITKLAVLVTDGRANLGINDTQREANLTKAQNVEVFTIGITSEVSLIAFTQGVYNYCIPWKSWKISGNLLSWTCTHPL